MIPKYRLYFRKYKLTVSLESQINASNNLSDSEEEESKERENSI